MSIFEDADRAIQSGDATPESDTDATDADASPARESDAAERARLAGGAGTPRSKRGSAVDIAGETVTIKRPETEQPDSESGNWITGGDAYGVPRGIDAVENRQIVQTAPMQSIVNGIVDQLLGGDLVFLDDENAMDQLSDAELDAAESFRQVLRDVLTGPHMGDEDLDDLVTAAVEDMLGVGNAYWQLLESETGEFPVASLTTLDPLTIRHNFDEKGYPEDPPYYQAMGAFSGGGGVAQAGAIDPVKLQTDDIAVMRYPKGARSYRRYPVSAAWQVKEWLEILANSTTHHNRYYSDNEIPPGLLQVVGGNKTTIQNIKEKVQEASGDPRDFPVVSGDGPANWIEMGGTAINLDVIQEQQWFYQLCLGSLGLGKSEVGMIEDTNRANGKIEAERVTKRVAGPFGKQFEQAFLHIARQFDVFRELGEPFTPTLAHTDPRAEAAKEEQLRKDYEAGRITLRQYVRRAGDENLAENDDQFTTTVNGVDVNYGDVPRWLAERKVAAATGEPQGEVGAGPESGEGED